MQQSADDRLFAALVVAAGRGARAGITEHGAKQFHPVGGVPVIARTLETLLAHPNVGPVVVVHHEDDEDAMREALGCATGHVTLWTGGADRQVSVLNGLRRLAAMTPAPDFVLIHDGVRLFADAALIGRVMDAVTEMRGAVPAIAVSDTLKRVDGEGTVHETVERSGLFGAQTPQGFPFAAILDAHEKAAASGRSDFTDDASIAEWAGLPVRLVEGDAANVKLTWARDIAMADRMLSEDTLPDVRTGSGYDVHALGPGGHVTLCGVRIAHDHALVGHSDADVALHALTDALLATCGAGDIGDHFPPSDPQWKGASSDRFLAFAASLVRERGGRVTLADVTLIAEAPKIGPHREAMRMRLAEILDIDVARCSVKATTNEKIGFVGRREGIAAIATATVVFGGDAA